MFSSKRLGAMLVAAAAFAVTTGCGDGGYATPAADGSAVSSTTEETTAVENSTAETPAEETAPKEKIAMERVVAETGVGAKGRDLEPGIMTSSARALFRTKERLVFIQVEHALNLFRASDGDFPKSHEQFMAKIIKANNIKLPELPAGAKYVYDPAKGELMVERPRR